MSGPHYEISPREREDEQIRDYHDFDHVDETYDEYLLRVTQQFDSRLSELPEAGPKAGLQHAGGTTTATPGTGSSESRDKDAA